MRSGLASRRWFHAGLLAGSFLAVMWGTLAFGAVYPWAYRPLMIACASLGMITLLVEWRGRPRIGLLAIGLSAIALSIALQLVPFSITTVAALNPGGDAFLRRYDLSYGVPRGTTANPALAPDRGTATHPLSIAPERTVLGLSLYLPLAVFFLGMIRLLSVTGAAVLAKSLTIFGVALAFIGIAQYELSYTQVHPLVYGFWKPRYEGGRPFGPFINANHFAGWMLMVLPVTLGVFYDTLSQALDEASTYTKDRMALAGSPRMGSLVVLGFSSVIMGLALIMTRSRSGIAAFGIGSAMAGTIIWRRQKTGKARAIVLVSFLALFGGAAIWAGAESFVSKFATSPTGNEVGSLGGRLSAWRDTLRIVHDSPYTGTGLNTFGTAMVFYQTGRGMGRFQEAHNDYLQIAAEGGLLIGLPVLFTLGVFVWSIRRRFHQAPKGGSTYWIRVGAVIGLILIALQSLFEFSLQMPGNAALFALVAALAVHQSPHLRRL